MMGWSFRRIKEGFSQGLFRDTYRVVLLKVGKVLLALYVNITLGRWIGAEGLGYIDLSLRLLQVAGVVVSVGIARFLLRESAILDNAGKKAELSGLLRRSIFMVLAISAPLSVLAVIFRKPIAAVFFEGQAFVTPFFWVALFIAPQALLVLTSGILNGLKHVFSSQLIIDVFKVIAVSIGVFLMVNLRADLSVEKVAILYFVGGLIALAYAVYLIWPYVKKSPIYELSRTQIYKEGFPFLLIFGLSTMNSSFDMLMLGWLGSAASVGIYSAAFKLAFLSRFFLTAGSASLSPRISADYAAGRYRKVSKQYSQLTLLFSLIGAAIFILFLFFGRDILGYWGEEFKAGYNTLVILGFAQLCAMLTGNASTILVYTGHQKLMSKISFIKVLLNFFLFYALIKWLGPEGAALALLIDIVAANLVVIYFIQKRTKLDLFYWLRSRSR